jgi:hypothetical protein
VLGLCGTTRASSNLSPNNDDLECDQLRQGNLLPFALNASPKGVSFPPPVALSWHCPQTFPVSAANLAVASAGRELMKQAVPAIKINAAVLKTTKSGFLASTFIVISGVIDAPRTVAVEPNPCTQMFGELAI